MEVKGDLLRWVTPDSDLYMCLVSTTISKLFCTRTYFTAVNSNCISQSKLANYSATLALISWLLTFRFKSIFTSDLFSRFPFIFLTLTTFGRVLWKCSGPILWCLVRLFANG